MRRLVPALAVLLVLALAHCAGSQQAARPSGGETGDVAAPYVRQIAPFVVRGADGEPHPMPFVGGFNVPRPQLVDIDGDGDLDLFVQEETNRVMFFENTGTPDEPEFTWRTDKYQDLDVGEWYRFNDLDDDGVMDLLAETPYSYIRYYHNAGTPTDPAFMLVTDTLKDAGGEPIFSDRQNIPNVTDLDCDGRSDLFLGRLDGTITHYEQVNRAAEGAPRFELVTENFEGIEIIGAISVPGAPAPNVPNRPAPNTPAPNVPQWQDDDNLLENLPPGGSTPGSGRPTLHGANTMAFADVDGDGNVDLLWGDYFEPGLLLIENTGTCASPNLRTEPQPFPPPDPLISSGYNAPTVGALSGEGRLDLLVGVIGGAFNPISTARENLYYYEQQPDGGYALQTRRFLRGVDVGSESVPALADIDGDGDLDLLVGNKLATDGSRAADLVVFENTGTPAAPAFALRDTVETLDSYNFAPALGDLDGDGAPDLLLGTWNDGMAYYRGDGEGGFTLADSVLLELPRGSHTAPALVDIEGDGDPDLFVGETAGTINFFENTGTPEAPRFELVTETFADINAGRRSAPAFVDLDGDGGLDLVVGTESEGLFAYRNTGTPTDPEFSSEPDPALALPERVQPLASSAFGDVDGDGQADLFLGGHRGGLTFYRHRD